MLCPDCKTQTEAGSRFCSQCGTYLSVRPGFADWDLLQLSPESFLDSLAIGLPLIWLNADALWSESKEIAALGPRRAVGIMQALAEEEAAKVLLLFDAMRCPSSMFKEFRRLVRQVDQHLGKGIYARYYGTSPGDIAETKRIVEYERSGFVREGEFGEFILPNSITTGRESRLYVSYIRNDDGSHEWHQPFDPSFRLSGLGQSAAIRVADALYTAGLFKRDALAFASEFWRKKPFHDVGTDPLAPEAEGMLPWRSLTNMNIEMLHGLFERNLLSSLATLEVQQTIAHDLLFPLYPFDLAMTKNFDLLPEPDWPGEY